MDRSTTLEQELTVQRQFWHLRPRYEQCPWFDQLLRAEFVDPQQQVQHQSRRLSRVVRFAANAVSYYYNLFAKLRLSPEDIVSVDDLAKLPVLSQQTLIDKAEQLKAAQLPRGERLAGYFSSSGTTGRPKRVLMTMASNQMFSLLAQRQYRIYRFDPAGTFAKIRWANRLPMTAKGEINPDGETLQSPAWRYVGQFFETGPEVSFNITNPVDQKIAWLQQQQPQYLQCYSGSLEHLALASEGNPSIQSLRAVQAISEQLTPTMRRRIENTLQVPVEQNYGLNEIGMVAVRCPAGRYHVHTEHCWVEIVDEEGQPCPPGQRGRIVVTALQNLAMPLLRYDTDDTAIAYTDPCPCGRTLPSFGQIAGRYRRYLHLPEGTIDSLDCAMSAIETMPQELIRPLRQYQLHQYRDGRFELRVKVAAPLSPGFNRYIQDAWQAAEMKTALTVVEVDQIERSQGGKSQYITSDFFPTADG